MYVYTDESLYLDDAELFLDFELAKEQEELGIVHATDSLNNESSSINSGDKDQNDKDDIPPSPGSKIRDRKLSEQSDKHLDDGYVVKTDQNTAYNNCTGN